jgi:hypothetical protein
MLDEQTSLSAERRDVVVVPGVSHLLVAAVVDEAGAEHALVVKIEKTFVP